MHAYLKNFPACRACRFTGAAARPCRAGGRSHRDAHQSRGGRSSQGPRRRRLRRHTDCVAPRAPDRGRRPARHGCRATRRVRCVSGAGGDTALLLQRTAGPGLARQPHRQHREPVPPSGVVSQAWTHPAFATAPVRAKDPGAVAARGLLLARRARQRACADGTWHSRPEFVFRRIRYESRMRKLWRGFVNFFVEALTEDTTSVAQRKHEAARRQERWLKYLS